MRPNSALAPRRNSQTPSFRLERPRRQASGILVPEFLFVALGADNLVFVGASTNPLARITALNESEDAGATLVFTGLIDGRSREIAMAAREVLAASRCAGDWFDVTPDVAVGALHRASFRLHGELTQLAHTRVADLIAGQTKRFRSAAPAFRLAAEQPAPPDDADRGAFYRWPAFLRPTKFKLIAICMWGLFAIAANAFGNR